MRVFLRRLVRLLAVALVLGASTIAAVRSAPLQMGADVSGAPFEFYRPNSHVPVGFDIDLINAMGAKMGRNVVVVNHQFDDLLAAVRRGKFDIAMSAMSDTAEREKLVDFVDYFIGGGGLMVTAGNPYRIFAIDGLCGYSVTVETGTSYASDLKKQSDRCKALGLGPVNVMLYNTDDDAYAAFKAGKSAAYVADFPVIAWRASDPSGKGFEAAGKPFDVVPYGIAVAKENVALRQQIVQALLAVVADGTYDKLLAKWGITRGGLRFAPVNAGKLY